MCEQKAHDDSPEPQQDLFDTEEEIARRREVEFEKASRWACYDG